MKHEKQQTVTVVDTSLPPAEPEKAMLPLDEARSIALTVKNVGTFIYRFRRIGITDWMKYYQDIVHQVINVQGAREEVFETESSLLSLVDATLISADGYGDTSKVKNWRTKLPFQHRLAAGFALRSVGGGASAAASSLLCDLVEVSLDATWANGRDGKTVLYVGLIHRFRQPSIDDLKKFNFESARTRVTGTADAGVTTYPSRQAIAMKIYDDLIESVDGYSVGGRPLEGAENIKREMDGAHKAAAVLELFSSRESITIQ